MNVTEKEAGKKWCSQEEREGVSPMCHGSRCMAWRWSELPPRPGFIPYAAEPNRTGDEPEEKRAGLGIPVHFEWSPANREEEEYTAGWREPSEFADGRRRGYCGRAGAPNLVGDLIDALARNAERIAP